MATGKQWMQSAVKRPGAFRAKARRAGMSTQAYARKEKNDPNASPRTRKQANLAMTFAKYRNKNRSKSRSSGRK